MPVNTPRLTKELAAAYFTTDYIVDNRPNSFRLRAGGLSRQLQLLHSEKGVTCSAYLTACNPFSQPLSSADNELKMNDLKADLEGKWEYQTGEGKDPEGRWPGEPSLLILGIPEEDAHRLAVKYGQFAYLFCKSGSNGALPMFGCRQAIVMMPELFMTLRTTDAPKVRTDIIMKRDSYRPLKRSSLVRQHDFVVTVQSGHLVFGKAGAHSELNAGPRKREPESCRFPIFQKSSRANVRACAGTEVIKPEQIAYENYHSPTNTGLPDYFHLVISAVVAESRWGKPYRESRIGRIPLKLLARHVGDRF
jgi:hypothetical protein